MSSSSSHHDDEPLGAERLARLETALAGLERRRAPRALRSLVTANLAASGSGALAGNEDVLAERAEASMACLQPLTAPAELRQRVLDDLATRTPIAALLRGLELHRAPHVLRRLVDEEVADPKAPIVRFVRSLPRQSAPVRSLLELDVDQDEPARGQIFNLAPATWRVAVAALVVAAVGAASFQFAGDTRRDDRPTFRLQRHFVEDATALSPMSRGLVMGMAPDAWVDGRIAASRDGGAR